jgi:hypothetical protein
VLDVLIEPTDSKNPNSRCVPFSTQEGYEKEMSLKSKEKVGRALDKVDM